MSLEIVPFDAGHLSAAARLLSSRHRAFRREEPDLPERYEDPEAVLPLIKEARRDALGVAAVHSGRLVGYLLGQVGPSGGSRSAVLRYAGHAAEAENTTETYRAMYAAVAPQWLDAGCPAHEVSLAPGDGSSIDTWVSLGFEQHTVQGFRPISTSADTREAAGVDVRRAGPGDLDDIVQLEDGLRRYQAGSPIAIPYPPKRRAAMPGLHERLLADPANGYWLASGAGRSIGYQLFMPVPETEMLPQPAMYVEHAYTEPEERGRGVGTVLLRRGMAWAREAGYAYCETDWLASNPLASRFWPRQGFRLLACTLRRLVDQPAGRAAPPRG